MNKPKIKVILGSIREGRNGIKVAEWFMNAVKEFDGADIELVDLKEYPLPLFADAESPMMRGTKENANPQVQTWLNKLNEGDGFIFITAEYNHGIPGVFKNAIDYALAEWHNKPVGFVSYGGSAGGSRSIEQLRQVVAELSMYDIREEINIPFIWAAFDEQGNLPHNDSLKDTANVIISKVSDLALKLKTPVTLNTVLV